MGVHVVKVPDIGEGIAEVEVVVWYVQPGDRVLADHVIADVMTDKATVEVPSPVTGRVLALGGKAGEKLAVGSELVRLEVEGADSIDAGETAVRSPAAPTAGGHNSRGPHPRGQISRGHHPRGGQHRRPHPRWPGSPSPRLRFAAMPGSWDSS